MLKRSGTAAIALYGWVNGTLASGVAHLDERLGFSATLVGAHLAAFAAGLLVTGALPTVERLARIAPLVFGTTLVWFLAAPNAAVSLAACALLGASGSLTLARAQIVLVDPLVSADPARTLMVANVVAAGTAAISAALVGAIDERLVIVTTAPAVGLAIVAFGMHRTIAAAPTVPASPDSNQRRPVAEMIGLALIASYVAIEFTVANQLSGFLVGVGIGAGVSSTAAGVMFAGIMLGRILVALSGTDRTAAVTIGAAATTFLALVVVTVAPSDPAVLATVLLLGMALGPLYPLLITRILAASATPARTSALATSAIGTALLVAPPSVGAARDVLGDRAGLSVLTVLAAAAVVMTVVLAVSRPSRPTPQVDLPRTRP